MNKHIIAYIFLLVGLLFISSETAHAQTTNGQGSDNALHGSWKVVVTPEQPGPPPFLEMITFDSGGGLTESNIAFPPNAASPGHGSWKRAKGERKFVFTFVKFLFDQQGGFSGTLKSSGVIFMSRDGQTWNGEATVKIFTANGNLVQENQASADAERIEAEDEN